MNKHIVIKFVSWVVVLLSLQACSGDNKSEESKPAGVIPQYQLDTLEQAKDTEAIILDADKKRLEQLGE
jgi:hypothetical protein